MRYHIPRIAPSEITPEEIYLGRRQLLTAGLATAALGGIGANSAFAASAPALAPLVAPRNAAMSISDAPNTYEDITTYNNYYEFGTGKDDPAVMAHDFKPTPWSVTVDGEAEVKGTFTLEDILKPLSLEERVYRLRCVEAWSMVIPWTGFPLASLVQRFKPTSKAKYVEFTTLRDAKRMPGQRYDVLQWPYIEGLRMDEAMHPLTFIAVGLYGKVIPNQNGAPLRLVVPWKYGFKNIKAIVRIRFTEKQPVNSWQVAIPNEYGFFANVNPTVDHPRWSQASERRIGGGLLAKRAETQMFNGYAAQVSSLYTGMDLRRNYLNLTQQFRFIYKPLVFLACAVPAGLMLAGIANVGPMDLGADPVSRLIHACGITALNLLLITLLVTPVRQLTGWNHVLRLRRMLGLFAFFYVLLHFTCYAWLDQGLDLKAVLADIVKRPYITVGMTALLLLIPLAVTSTNAMMRRLGRRWTTLHRLIYVIAALGIWHFWWQVKKDIREPLLYVGMFAVLMAWRIFWQLRAKSAPARARGNT